MRIIGDLVLAGFGQLKNARIENLSSDPGAPQNGQIWFNTTDGVYRGYNGTATITFANGGNTQSIIDALAVETTARIAADSAEATARDAAIAVETSARSAADTTLQNNINAEASTRASADTTNANAIAAETTARSGADTTLQSNIDAEATARAGADTTLQNNINTEASARIAADSAESTARAAADTTNANAIAAETTARTDADATETSARIAADNAEATARSGADSTLQANIDTEASARTAADALKVAKAGDSMSGNLAFGGTHTVTGIAEPTAADHAASKNYVDSTVSGLSWKQAVNSVGSSNPGTATTGDRFLNTTDGKIYQATATDTWNAGTAAVDGDAVFDRSSETGYVYSGSAWTVFTGTGQIAAGVGLSKTGNQLDVNLGAGIAQLPSDEVGLDVRATGGVFLTEDGTTPSSGTDAQLAIRLSDSSLTLGGSGVQVSSAIQTALSTATTDIAAEVTNRVAAVSAEATARAGADTTLQNNINAEATARADADTTNANAISAEATARADAIIAEASARSGADTTLQNNINAEATTRAGADTTNANAIAAEATSRAGADTTLQGNIDAEATARSGADVSEASARAAADTTINTRITNGHFVYDGSSANTTHTVTHNLGVKFCQVLVADSASKVIIPDSITFSNTNELVVEFISAITCTVVVSAPKALA